MTHTLFHVLNARVGMSSAYFPLSRQYAGQEILISRLPAVRQAAGSPEVDSDFGSLPGIAPLPSALYIMQY
jgi:hypothetical protein